MTTTMTTGRRAEALALKHLVKQGLRHHQSNYYSRYGEIDLIMQERDYLVFVEVRYRKNNNFGGALASVDYHKQQKLRRCAEHYLIEHKKTQSPCRFDVLCLTGDLKKVDFDWLKNVF